MGGAGPSAPPAESASTDVARAPSQPPDNPPVPPPPAAPRPPKRKSGSPPSAQRSAGKKPRAERKRYVAFDGLEERRKFPVGNSDLGHAPMTRRCADDAPGGDARVYLGGALKTRRESLLCLKINFLLV